MNKLSIKEISVAGTLLIAGDYSGPFFWKPATANKQVHPLIIDAAIAKLLNGHTNVGGKNIQIQIHQN